MDEHLRWRERAIEGGARPTPVIDRFWFRSIYFREPSGVLFEIATLGPGFDVDEDPEHLGEKLILPPFLEDRREEIEAQLVPIANPRVAARRMSDGSTHLLREPAGEPQGALILNHGRGADEHDLFGLLDALDPERRLLGVTHRRAADRRASRRPALVPGAAGRLPRPGHLRRQLRAARRRSSTGCSPSAGSPGSGP